MCVCVCLPYSVARAAGEVFDPDVGGAGAHGDAIIAGANLGGEDGNS